MFTTQRRKFMIIQHYNIVICYRQFSLICVNIWEEKINILFKFVFILYFVILQNVQIPSNQLHFELYKTFLFIFLVQKCFIKNKMLNILYACVCISRWLWIWYAFNVRILEKYIKFQISSRVARICCNVYQFYCQYSYSDCQ